MTTLTAVLIDSQEPKWVQELRFKALVPTITALHVGDAWLTTDDNATIIVERKTANDLINSVLDDGLRNQCVRIANETTQIIDLQKETMSGFLPILWTQSGHDIAQFKTLIAQNPMVAQHFTILSPEAQQAMGQIATWKYLVYTRPSVRGEFAMLNGAISKIRWRHILGVLVDAQELGITCIPIAADSEYGGTLEWIATRNHGDVKARAHRRKGIMETQAEFFLSGLKGIQNRASMLLKTENGNGIFESAAWALDWLCNLESEFKVPGIATKTKQNVRRQVGLADDERLGVINQQWERIAACNQMITIEEAGHIWVDDDGLEAFIRLLAEARPSDPALKKLLEKEK